MTDLRTCLQAVDGECGLSQEVLVIEHVDLIHHKAQEGEGRVAHGELESLSGPGGIQAIVSWRMDKELHLLSMHLIRKLYPCLSRISMIQMELRCHAAALGKQRHDLTTKRKPVLQLGSSPETS